MVDEISQTLNYLQIRLDKESKVDRHIFFKVLDKNKKKNVLMFNIPLICDHNILKKFLEKHCSSVVSITFYKTMPTVSDVNKNDNKKLPIDGYRIAWIIFDDQKGYQKLVKLHKSEDTLYLIDDNRPITGIEKWKNDYNQSIIANTKKEKKILETYINEYKEKLKEAEKNRKQTEPDEDGFIKYVNKKKRISLNSSQ